MRGNRKRTTTCLRHGSDTVQGVLSECELVSGETEEVPFIQRRGRATRQGRARFDLKRERGEKLRSWLKWLKTEA